jgi:hypothetical protein
VSDGRNKPTDDHFVGERLAGDGGEAEVLRNALAADPGAIDRHADDAQQHPVGGRAQTQRVEAEIRSLGDQRQHPHAVLVNVIARGEP